MEKKIEAATANGVDMFLFDWYWYASPTLAPHIVPDLQVELGYIVTLHYRTSTLCQTSQTHQHIRCFYF
jgi:hypothetical protein